MKELNYHYTIPVQIRWNDWDRFGHINNATYFELFDTGKITYLEIVCPDVDWSKCAMMMVHDETDFVSQIKEFNNISVRTAVVKIGHKSVTFYQEIFNHRNGEIKAHCLSVMVYFDAATQLSAPVPQPWVDAIRAFDGDNIE